MPTTQHKKDENAIRKLIANWSRAVEEKKPKAIVKDYTPNTVLFDAIPTGKTVGADAIAAIWAQCLPYFPDKFRSEHKDLVVEVDGDLAFIHGLHHFVPEPADHPCGSTWMRITAGFRRMDGKWCIIHEHVSVPFDPMTGKAAFLDQDGEVLAQPAMPQAAGNGQPAMAPVTPHLVCSDASAAIAFYERAFGAVEIMRLPAPDGRLLHASVTINGGTIMLCDEFPEMGNLSPATLKGSPVTIHLTVDDVDEFTARAIAAGTKTIMPVADQFWGDRYGIVEDPFGHLWSIATPQRPMSPEDMAEAARSMMTNQQDFPGSQA